MKFLILLLLSASTYAQDTCDLNLETDQFTGAKKASTKMHRFSDASQTLLIFANRTGAETRTVFSLDASSPTCFLEKAKAIILFTDSTQQTLLNEGTLNCKGTFITTQSLTKTIKAIRFYGTEGYIDFNLNEGAGDLATQLACIKNAW